MGGDGGEKERSEEWDGGEGPGVVVVGGEMRSLVAERGSCSPPPPCKGTPPHSPQSKGHPAPLHSSRKGAQASAMPFRKKAPLWRFFGGAGCFFASFFFTRFFFFFWFFFLPLPPRSPAPSSLHCAGAQPCGPRCAAEPQHGSTVLSCLSDHPHSPFAIQLFAELNYEPAFFQKPDRSGKARGCSPAAAPVPPPTPRGSVTAACKVGRVPFRSLQRDCGSPRRFLG